MISGTQVSILSSTCGCSQSLPAVHSDWSVLAELLLGFVHLSNEINEALSGFWHPLLWPVGELELADCSGLAVLGDEKEQEGGRDGFVNKLHVH